MVCLAERLYWGYCCEVDKLRKSGKMPTKHKAYYARIEAGLCGQCGKRPVAVNSDGTKFAIVKNAAEKQ